MSVKFTTIPSKRLAESITASSTSLRLNNILSWDGVTNLSSSDVGTSVYAVLRNTSNTQIEIMELSGTTIASTEITITRRGLKFDGTLATEVAANKKTWIRNETIVELGTDAPQLFQYLKEYIDGIAIAGSPDASLIAKGLVESATTAEIDADTAAGATGADLSVRPDQLVASKYGTRLPSAAEKAALAAGGDFGTPSTGNKYITQEYNASATGLPVTRIKTTTATTAGSSTTQFDITNTAGTSRYTYDSTGTDPGISAVNNPVGSVVYFSGSNFTAANRGLFIVTASGSNYVEVSNASGVTESNKTLGTGYFMYGSAADFVWTKPTGLKYIEVEVQGGGSTGGDGSGTGGGGNGGGGGGGGAFASKKITASSLASTEAFLVGASLSPSVFGLANTIVALPGVSGLSTQGGLGGVATGGDINIPGSPGMLGYPGASSNGGNGGGSALGAGGRATDGGAGLAGVGYGSGGAGTAGYVGSGSTAGGNGTPGLVKITEYFS